MSDDGTPENHTLALLREIRTDMSAMRAEVGEVKAELREQGRRLDEQGRRLDEQGKALVKVIDAVTAIAQTQEKHSAVLGKMHEGQMIIERDLSAIKMRVERIERHTGLVQA